MHPARTRYDDCPVCSRPRCVDDARRGAELGCSACIEVPAAKPASGLELTVRAAIAALPAGLIGGPIAAEYVRVHLFSLFVPALIGLVATWLAGQASYRSGLGAWPVVTAGAVAGVLGTALGFRLYPHGPHDPLKPLSEVGLPYLCTVGGAVLWSLLLRPPSRRAEG